MICHSLFNAISPLQKSSGGGYITDAQIVEKYDDILVNHTRVFSVQLKQSLSADEVLEEITPDAQYFYEDMKKLYEDMMRDYREGVFNGASAYEIAAANGFEGTEEEWLESLRGKDGKDYEHSEEFSSLAQQIRNDKAGVDKAIERFDADYEAKTNSFDSNAETLLNAFNENADEKMSTYNSNHQEKIDSFNTGVQNKTNAFDDNAVEKTNEFNQNVTAKTNEFNQAVTNARQDAKANVLTDNVNASENHYLDDSYDTTFCNLEIRGKSTQVQETGIVPTPSRPVPLISKKVTVGNQVVELRSLKETGNMWDLKFIKKNPNVGDTANIIGNDIEFSGWAMNAFPNLIGLLKPNTTYSIMATIEMVEKIENENLTQASGNVGILLYRNSVEGLSNVSVWLVDKQTNADLGQGQELTVKKTFTAPSDLTSCSILFYSERYLDDSNNAYYSTVKFKDIVLVEGSAQPTGYIAPTVRDYLIVDDTNQTITVERNVNVAVYDGSEIFSYLQYSDKDFYKFGNSNKINDAIVGNNDYISNMFFLKPNINEDNSFQIYPSSNYVDIRCDTYNNVDDFKQMLVDKYNDGNPLTIYYGINNATIETIPYISGITSTYGLTTQDSVSPSPTIPSPIESVETLDIKVCGKNLINFDNVNYRNCVLLDKNDGSYKVSINDHYYSFFRIYYLNTFLLKNKGKYITFSVDNARNKKVSIIIFGIINGISTYRESTSNNNYVSTQISNEFQEITHVELRFARADTPYTDNATIYNNFMLCLGNISLPFQPYKEQVLSLELPFSFKSSLDGSVFDYIDVERGKYVQCLKEEVFDGSSDENWSFLHTTDYDICFVNYSNIAAKNGSAICNRYINYSYITGYSHGITVNVNGCICVSDGLHTGNVNDFKALLQEYPITVIYQLETPIEYDIPQETLEQLKALHSYTNITNITSNAPMSFEYVQHLQTVFNRLLQQINTLESEALNNV